MAPYVNFYLEISQLRWAPGAPAARARGGGEASAAEAACTGRVLRRAITIAANPCGTAAPADEKIAPTTKIVALISDALC